MDGAAFPGTQPRRPRELVFPQIDAVAGLLAQFVLAHVPADAEVDGLYPVSFDIILRQFSQAALLTP